MKVPESRWRIGFYQKPIGRARQVPVVQSYESAVRPGLGEFVTHFITIARIPGWRSADQTGQ
jgi:hypothetical protein